MATAPRSPKAGLSLSEVAEVTGVSPRQVIYLREKGVVVPVLESAGRGHECLYSVEETVEVFVAGHLLAFLDYASKARVVHALTASPHFPVRLGESFQLVADDPIATTELLAALREKAKERL